MGVGPPKIPNYRRRGLRGKKCRLAFDRHAPKYVSVFAEAHAVIHLGHRVALRVRRRPDRLEILGECDGHQVKATVHCELLEEGGHELGPTHPVRRGHKLQPLDEPGAFHRLNLLPGENLLEVFGPLVDR